MRLGVHISGELTATVAGPNGVRKYRGPNLITDVGLNGAVGLDSGSNLGAIGGISRLAVGTGNTPPTPQDTLLENYARAIATDSNYYPASLTTREGWAVYRFRETATFPPDGVARNYTEVGLFANTTVTGGNARMAQRALFRDELGAPTVVTVGTDEYLTVEWDTFMWRSVEDQIFNIEVDGVPTVVTVRPVNSTASVPRLNAWSISGMSFTGSPSSGWVYPPTKDLVDHTTSPTSTDRMTPTGTRNATPLGVGHVRMDYTIPPTEGNAPGGIGLICMGASGTARSVLWRFQMKFEPPIPKDVTKEMTFSVVLKAGAGEPPEE